MTEYGANHSIYRALLDAVALKGDSDESGHLERQLLKDIDVLDLTLWQKEKLRELNLKTVGEVLEATEEQLKLAKYVGDVRARRMRNAAVASVLEYLSG
jgi:DNA-directed RNA polymerase alpha subunit